MTSGLKARVWRADRGGAWLYVVPLRAGGYAYGPMHSWATAMDKARKIIRDEWNGAA